MQNSLSGFQNTLKGSVGELAAYLRERACFHTSRAREPYPSRGKGEMKIQRQRLTYKSGAKYKYTNTNTKSTCAKRCRDNIQRVAKPNHHEAGARGALTT